MADLGTKPLGPMRIKELCDLWNLKAMGEEGKVTKVSKAVVQPEKERWIQLLVILIVITGCRAQGNNPQPEEDGVDISVVVKRIAVVAVVNYRLAAEAVSGLRQGIRRLRVSSVERSTQTGEEEEVIEVPRSQSASVARSSSSTSGTASRSSAVRRRNDGSTGRAEVQPADGRASARTVEQETEDERLNARWREELRVMEQLRWRELQPEPEAVEVYHITSMGDRIHWRRNCYGLRNATVRGTRAVLPCPHCWPGEQQRARGARSYRGEDGFLHSNARCVGIGREPLNPMQPCRFCQGGVTGENFERIQDEGRWPRGLM